MSEHEFTPQGLLDVIDSEGGVFAAFMAGVTPMQLDESNPEFKAAFTDLYEIWERDLRARLARFDRLADVVEDE